MSGIISARHIPSRLLLLVSVVVGVLMVLGFVVKETNGMVYEVRNSTMLWDVVHGNRLLPGDEVVLREGNYTCYYKNSWLRNIVLKGLPNAPITIRSATGEKVLIEGDISASQNLLNFDVENFVFKGFELRYGDRGLRFMAASNIVLEDLHIHDTGDVGIAMNEHAAVFSNVTIRHVQIKYCHGSGEGMYLGCNNDDCRLINSLLEYNWVHHTVNTVQGDGIEVKRGSYNNIIRHNVIHDTHYPGITVYGASNGIPNIIDSNIIWNSGDNGIQMTANTVVRNNIVLNSRMHGISIQSNQGNPTDVLVEHNTVVGTLTGSCFSTSSTNLGSGFIVANNAFYCENGSAIIESTPNSKTVYGSNVVRGKVASQYIKNVIYGTGLKDFTSTSSLPYNVYPSSSGSSLIGISSYMSNLSTPWDFGGIDRSKSAVIDAGAYQHIVGKNSPSWIPVAGFKDGWNSPAQSTSPKYVKPVPPDNVPYNRTTYIITPRNGSSLFELMSKLQPGDTLYVREGVYPVKIGSSWFTKIVLSGSPSNPITVSAWPGERVVLYGDPYGSQNIINLEVMYFVFRGFEMVYGSRGIRLHESTHSIFEDLNVHHNWANTISANDKGAHYRNITFRHNRMAYSKGTGCSQGSCIFSDSLIEGNLCEFTCCTQGDGIELKHGSYNNIIRNNVIHDTLYPGITTYSTGGNPPNIIEGNLIFNTGDNGIQVTSGQVVRNNIIVNAGINGIDIHEDGIVSDLVITHNTVINSKASCMTVGGLQLASDVVIANNALFCENSQYAYYERYLSDKKTKTFYSARNYYSGKTNGVDLELVKVNSSSHDILLGDDSLNAYPTPSSNLIGMASSKYSTPFDFNGNVRLPTSDVGAYQHSTPSNPGWIPKGTFKDGYTSVSVTGNWEYPNTVVIPQDDNSYIGKIYDIRGGDYSSTNCKYENIWKIMASLKPGDSMIFHSGILLTQVCGHGSFFRKLTLMGSPNRPIEIKVAEGETVIIQGDIDQSQNIIDVAFYNVIFKGFTMKYGSRGLRIYEAQNTTFERLEISQTGDVGVAGNDVRSDYNNVTLRHLYVHHTHGTGECFYLGTNYGESIWRNSIIEYNHCAHTTSAEQGDGIELKAGSYGNIIRHNVIHDTNYPGITLYTPLEGMPPNIVYGNIIWNTQDNGIQVTGNTIIKNNIVMNAKYYGIAIQPNQQKVNGLGNIENVAILHNTVVGVSSKTSGACFASSGTSYGKGNIVIAGNAFYCGESKATREVNVHPNTIYGINIVSGASSMPGVEIGDLFADFLDVSSIPYNLYPKKGGKLYAAANLTLFNQVSSDFNGLTRSSERMDVGALQYIEGKDSNPGWIPTEGFIQQPSGDTPLLSTISGCQSIRINFILYYLIIFMVIYSMVVV